MPIKYNVIANPLKVNTYYPKVVGGGRVPFERLIDDICSETTLTETDIRAVINALRRRVVAYLLEGQTLSIEGLVSFSTSMSEQIASASMSASQDVILHVRTHAAPNLEKQVRTQARLERVYTRERAPVLTALYDVQSQREGVYTPGSIARLSGNDLKFDLQSEDEGIFFCSVDTDRAVRITIYAHLGVREVIFLVPPDMQDGQYVELRTRFGNELLRVGRMHTGVVPAMTAEPTA